MLCYVWGYVGTNAEPRCVELFNNERKVGGLGLSRTSCLVSCRGVIRLFITKRRRHSKKTKRPFMSSCTKSKQRRVPEISNSQHKLLLPLDLHQSRDWKTKTVRQRQCMSSGSYMRTGRSMCALIKCSPRTHQSTYSSFCCCSRYRGILKKYLCVLVPCIRLRDLRFSQWWKYELWCFGLWRRVVLQVVSNVSEELTVPIFYREEADDLLLRNVGIHLQN
jgi:hypothetical protein